jgi:hypothetical protein
MVAAGEMPQRVPSGVRRRLWSKAAVESAIRVLSGDDDRTNKSGNTWDEIL